MLFYIGMFVDLRWNSLGIVGGTVGVRMIFLQNIQFVLSFRLSSRGKYHLPIV